jgi:hypothetical protein
MVLPPFELSLVGIKFYLPLPTSFTINGLFQGFKKIADNTTTKLLQQVLNIARRSQKISKTFNKEMIMENTKEISLSADQVKVLDDGSVQIFDPSVTEIIQSNQEEEGVKWKISVTIGN